MGAITLISVLKTQLPSTAFSVRFFSPISSMMPPADESPPISKTITVFPPTSRRCTDLGDRQSYLARVIDVDFCHIEDFDFVDVGGVSHCADVGIDVYSTYGVYSACCIVVFCVLCDYCGD